MITILHNLEKGIDKPEIPSEVWAEWKASHVTRHIYNVMREMQIDALDKLIEPDSCVRSCRAKLEILETIINYTSEGADV